MTVNREVHADGWCVRLDIGRQVLRLEVAEADTQWQPGARHSAGPPLLPVPPLGTGPVSASTLLLKAKQFDDGLYAAVELAAQEGVGRFSGKAPLLRCLATTLANGLPAAEAAAAVIHAACELGDVPVAVPDAIAALVRSTRDDFLADELKSKPVGFYTWTPELMAIFRQDRLLQRPLDPVPADDIARALERTPGALAAYDACLRLNARLTNGAKPLTAWDAGKRPPFFPPSRSHEVTLFERLYGDRPIPESFDLMGELIRRVRSGEVSLMPGANSGWYDHQTWSLEPLLVPDRRPETARLELGKRYRKHMEDLFRGAMGLTRETHARQAAGGRGGYGGPSQQPVFILPDLTVEPLPTVYTRRAAAYRFVRSVLEEAFGADALEAVHRLTPDGSAPVSIGTDLTCVEELFTGAAATAMREVGMGPTTGVEAAVDRFSAWQAGIRSDADVSSDARMMVPVFYDEQRRKTKVWAFLGWRTTAVDVTYRSPPIVTRVEALVEGKAMREPPPVLFSGDRYELAVPVVAEVYVSTLMNRDEFRRHCDRHKSRDAILANLPRP